MSEAEECVWLRPGTTIELLACGRAGAGRALLEVIFAGVSATLQCLCHYKQSRGCSRLDTKDGEGTGRLASCSMSLAVAAICVAYSKDYDQRQRPISSSLGSRSIESA